MGRDVSEDLNYLQHKNYFDNKQLHLVYGTNDPFLTPERLAAHQQLIDSQQLIMETSTFEGNHTVERETLQQVEKRIRNT